MAPLSFFLPLFFAAQALSLTTPSPTITSQAALTTSIPSAITPAPAFTQTICADNLHNYVAKDHSSKKKFFCPGVVSGLNGNDISSAYCCINAIFVPEIPLTSWYYNHTDTYIPSTIITPSCVQPIPLTASNYDAQVSAAAPAMTGPQIPMGTPGNEVEIDVDTGAVAFVTKVGSAASAAKTATTYTGARYEGAAGKKDSKPLVALIVALAGVLVGGAI